jgi:hypothetical protein
MRCEFIYTGKINERGKFVHKCERCNVERGSNHEDPKMLTAQCAAVPSLTRRAKNLLRDSTAHAIDFFALVDAGERANRLAACKACDLHNGKICTHPDCGCPMQDEQNFLDALSWRSKQCPLGKW